MLLSNSVNYLNQPKVLFIVNKSKNIEVIEMIEPKIIKEIDLSLTFCTEVILENKILSF